MADIPKRIVKARMIGYFLQYLKVESKCI